MFVHESGHFLFAKWCGIRVDAFAIGFPPTLFKKKKGETTYKLNLLPLGGYVSIYGENYDTLKSTDKDYHRSFVMKKPWQQFIVLIGGILFNMIFALLVLIVVGWIGAPSMVDDYNPALSYNPDVSLSIAQVVADSPADMAGLRPGDAIISLATESGLKLEKETLTIEGVSTTIQSASNPIELTVNQSGEVSQLTLSPEPGIGTDGAPAIGIGMVYSKFARDNFGQGIANGWKSLINMTHAVGAGLGQLISGKANVSDLTGPVGLTTIVGEASQQGFAQLLLLTAFISINLALLNLLPFPALDGGRIVFVLIEAITKKRIPAKVGMWVNGIGFMLLMLLMIAVTVKDVIGLF